MNNKEYQIGAGDIIKFKKHGEIIVGKGKSYIGMTIQELENKYNDKILEVKRPTQYKTTFMKKEILDEAEKRYLKAVIRPFKDKVEYIEKIIGWNGYYISIMLKDNDSVNLPYFRSNEMYKGMETDKTYSTKELGLYE